MNDNIYITKCETQTDKRILVKDNICTKGIRTTAGSQILDNFIPDYDATVIEKLKAAGFEIDGKSNMDEFGFGSTTETSYYGVVENPHNPLYVPGGSSGGSAAAVAKGLVRYALGTDTGGSIRQPASHCGVTGIKPTYGTVSRYGLIAYASSMDTIGPIAKNVKDSVEILDVIIGKDEKDATSVEHPKAPLSQYINVCAKGMKIAVWDKLCTSDKLSPFVLSAYKKTIADFEKMGFEIVDIDISLIEKIIPAYYTIACCEASSNLERYDGIRYGYKCDGYKMISEKHAGEYVIEGNYRTPDELFEANRVVLGDEVKKRIAKGKKELSSGFYKDVYIKACEVRDEITKELSDILNKYDVLLLPVAPATAPKLGECLKDTKKMYLADLFTVLANLTGMPAISVPVRNDDGSLYKDENNLPVGYQMISDKFCEDRFIRVASMYERVKNV